MKAQRVFILVLVGLALLFLAWRLIAPQFRPAPALSGYIEGETLYLSAPVAGTVTELGVRRGQLAAAGAPLFVLEPNPRQHGSASCGEGVCQDVYISLVAGSSNKKH